jgi:acetyl esterase/lipase
MRLRLGIACAAVAAGLVLGAVGLLHRDRSSTAKGGTPSSSSAASEQIVETSVGTGADRVWIFRPAHGEPKHVVLFVHGLGDQLETTPFHHRPWLEHLAAEGNAVLYPRFELHPFEAGGLRHLVKGARLGWRELHTNAPVLAIGYSRGGRLVMDYAARAHGVGPVPSTVLSVFPSGLMDSLQDLRTIRKGTKVVLLAGDKDETVGTHGVNQLVTQLAASGFPYDDLKYQLVRSHGAFVATHLSVLDDSPGARAAYWARADRLLAAL